MHQNIQAYFQSEVTICAQARFKLVLSIVEMELPINLKGCRQK
jgi:hypothetical protein